MKYLSPRKNCVHGSRSAGSAALRWSAAICVALAIAMPAMASGACNNAATVGGGTLLVSPSAGAGWDVGSGQCNGDFTVVTNSLFPGGALELGMRIEQRSQGQINPPQHSGVNYEVQTGADPSNLTRAWWNFQHSIAYNGGIGTLDNLTFAIRRDVGTQLPAQPVVDMLALRAVIDDRHVPKSTASFTDIYQTSQNPTFGWFSPAYNLTDSGPGAWTLTLAAVKAGKISSVSICAHTPDASCATAPVVYTCAGFDAPMDKVISVKKNNRVLPLKMVCTDGSGNVAGAGNIAAPIVQVTKTPAGPATDPVAELLSAGQGTDGNEFVFSGSQWAFNLQTKNFTGTGTYTITVVAGGTDLLVNAPTATFVVQ